MYKKNFSAKETTATITDKICIEVTEKICQMLEQGVNPWRKPWTANGQDCAMSYTTGRAYSFLNQLYIMAQGGKSGEYLTFKQAKALGGNVRKGARSKVIVFWTVCSSRKAKDTNEDGEEVEITITKEYQYPVLKKYHVFHIDDCEGIKSKRQPGEAVKVTETTAPEIAAVADAFAKSYVNKYGIDLQEIDTDRAYYRPSADYVQVPRREQYPNTNEFFSTLYHELTHSTGHPSRLNRFNTGIVASDGDYSREELTAELGAAYCLAHIGIENDNATKNSAAYLAGWAKHLRNNPREFTAAAGRAEKACAMILNL